MMAIPDAENFNQFRRTRRKHLRFSKLIGIGKASEVAQFDVVASDCSQNSCPATAKLQETSYNHQNS